MIVVVVVRRLEMEMAARAIAKSAAEEEATRRRSGDVDPGAGRSIAGGGLLGVMANGANVLSTMTLAPCSWAIFDKAGRSGTRSVGFVSDSV